MAIARRRPSYLWTATLRAVRHHRLLFWHRQLAQDFADGTLVRRSPAAARFKRALYPDQTDWSDDCEGAVSRSCPHDAPTTTTSRRKAKRFARCRSTTPPTASAAPLPD